MSKQVALPRVAEKYKNEVVPVLKQEFKYENVMRIPRLQKVVVNIGVKEGQEDVKLLEQLAAELTVITGQKPSVRRSKKSIAGFKLREGSAVGLKVTLRRARMYEFIDRFFNVASPRIRDFRGFPDKAFDERGNYSLGINDQTIFPEVEFDKVKRTKGMNITFVTTAQNHKEAKRLLELLGLPFIKKEVKNG